MTARIEIVVDELIVRGLPPEQARVAAAALESRLAALAANPGASLRGRSEAFRRLPQVAVTAASPGAVGEAAASAVWGALADGGSR